MAEFERGAHRGKLAQECAQNLCILLESWRQLKQNRAESLAEAACDFRPEGNGGNTDTLVRELPGPDGRPRTVRVRVEADVRSARATLVPNAVSASPPVLLPLNASLKTIKVK